ncbi:MAG: response regulator [Gemmatimonadota bacterium]|nr:response regulator [Gemmatimonadota bacterium]
MILVDTSAWVAYLRGTGSEADHALQRLLSDRARLFTTDTVMVELLAGAGDEEAARRVSGLLFSLERCTPPGPLDLERAGHLYRAERKGDHDPVSLSSCLVAAVALRDDLPVLAEDDDFATLARTSGLRLWETDRSAPRQAPTAPAARAPDVAPARARSTSAEAVVLVVEDEPSAARLLDDALADPGRRLVHAGSGREARARIAERPPGAIVLDLILPDEDGRNLLADLRRDPSTKDAGVVIVTGKAGPRTREECFALGADAFFDKPFDEPKLSRAVEGILVEGRASTPDPDPLLAPLTLSEVQKRLKADREGTPGQRTWTVGLLEITTGAGEAGSATEDGDGRLLPSLLRTVIQALLARLEEGELLARWGVNQLVVVSALRSEAELLTLVRDMSTLQAAGDHVSGGVRRVGHDEDLLDAVATMAARIDDIGTDPAPSIVPLDEKPTGRPRAALVEDDPITAGLVRHRLERSGFLVDHSTDGEVALDAILKEPPSVAILDIQLPSMDGFEILRRMKEHDTTRDVPVLMLTSLGREQHVRRGFELGADDYVTKPFSPSELLTRVLRLVRRK